MSRALDHVAALLAKSEADRLDYVQRGDGILATACQIEIAAYRKVIKILKDS